MRRAVTPPTDRTSRLAVGPWLSEASRAVVEPAAAQVARATDAEVAEQLEVLVRRNHAIHDVECLNLNPATNVMNPRAEALLAAGLGSRASLGHPGEKYETGLEAIERVEVAAAELVAEVFDASYAEVRVPSGAIANLYAFMATCEPGDTIIAPPPSIGGHVTHHLGGAAGLYRLTTVPAPVAPGEYTVDVDALRTVAREVRPRLITLGGSLNLHPHPVAAVREVADEVGATLLFDAAHVCGLVAGRQWPNPLREGAHLMTFSTYKSLGGPPAGAVVTDDPVLAERLDAIAYPGLTANFDAGTTAALAMTMVDWRATGTAYAEAMVATADRLARGLADRGIPVFSTRHGLTASHQLAVRAHEWGGGQQAAQRLRAANLLACGIGLPDEPVEGDTNGLRLGTPEVARLGMGPEDMDELAGLVADALTADPEAVAPRTTEFRARFGGVHFVA